jgi:hypothetical protein
MAKKILYLYYIKKSTQLLAKSDFVCVCRDKLVPSMPVQSYPFYCGDDVWLSNAGHSAAQTIISPQQRHEIIKLSG